MEAMRGLLSATGAIGFVLGTIAMLGAATVLHEIVAMLCFVIAMTGLGAAGIIGAVDKLRAETVRTRELADLERRYGAGSTVSASTVEHYVATPQQPVAAVGIHPIAQSHGRAKTDPGDTGAGSSV
jgi:hypothetical protein